MNFGLVHNAWKPNKNFNLKFKHAWFLWERHLRHYTLIISEFWKSIPVEKDTMTNNDDVYIQLKQKSFLIIVNFFGLEYLGFKVS